MLYKIDKSINFVRKSSRSMLTPFIEVLSTAKSKIEDLVEKLVEMLGICLGNLPKSFKINHSCYKVHKLTVYQCQVH